MTVQNPPLWQQVPSYSAEDDRRLLEALFNTRPGIVGLDSLAVTQTGVASMQVNVAGGFVLVDGTESPAAQGLYLCENRGTTLMAALTAAHATNRRIDLIVARVRDATYSGGTSAWALEAVAGTPAPVPAEPAVPANSFVLAAVTVRHLAEGGGTILTADIADRRLQSGKGTATTIGGRRITTSGQRPTTGLFEGEAILETDTNRALVWNGTAWVSEASYGLILPSWYNAVLAGGAATVDTVWASVPTVITAPFPLRMEVEISGKFQATGVFTAVAFKLEDETGASILQGHTAGEMVLDNDARRSSFHMLGYKDVATGGNCGFRSRYRSGSGSVGWNIDAACKVSFIPKAS